jgi:hypothetical protein
MNPITDKDIRSLLPNDGTEVLCTGFVIDGDMAVELKTYFGKERMGSRLVRCPFQCLENVRADIVVLGN